MPVIGATIRSAARNSPELQYVHNVIIPTFQEQAADESRPIIGGVAVDATEVVKQEQALRVNPESGALEVSVVDTTSIPLASVVGRTALLNGSSEYSIFSSTGVIAGHLHLASRDIPDGGGAPTLTYSFCEGQVTIARTRTVLEGTIGRTGTHEEFRGAASRTFGLPIDKTTPIGMIERMAVIRLADEARMQLNDSPIKPRFTEKLFHRPLRERSDFFNQRQTLTVLNRNTDELAEVAGIGKAVADMVVAGQTWIKNPETALLPKEGASELLDFWIEPSARAQALLYFFANGHIGPDVSAESVGDEVISAIQTQIRSSPTTSSVKKMRESVGNAVFQSYFRQIYINKTQPQYSHPR